MVRDENITAEEWRPVPGWEGLYQISNLGRLMSLDRVDRMGRPWRERLCSRAGRKYPRASLSKDGAVTYVYIHHLVAAAFIGPRPDGMVVCHNDGDPANNHVDNLRYDTQAGNIRDKEAHGTVPKGEAHHNTTLTADQVREIRRASGITQDQLAKAYGVSQSTIGRIIRRVTWRHI